MHEIILNFVFNALKSPKICFLRETFFIRYSDSVNLTLSNWPSQSDPNRTPSIWLSQYGSVNFAYGNYATYVSAVADALFHCT